MLAQAIQLNPLITSKLECCLINGMGTPNIQQFAIFRSILGIILPGKVLVKHCEAASLFSSTTCGCIRTIKARRLVNRKKYRTLLNLNCLDLPAVYQHLWS